MQAKPMIQAIAATLILTAAASWGSMIWNFDDGTSQGWKDQYGNNAEIQNWGGSNAIFTQVQNGGGATGSLSITGLLGQTVSSTTDYVQFSTLLSNNPSYPHSSYGIILTTSSGVYGYDVVADGNGSGSVTDLKLNLFTDLTKQSGTDLAVGDAITSIRFSTWGYSFAEYADNISLVVPEPASLALLALGGCCLLRRRR